MGYEGFDCTDITNQLYYLANMRPSIGNRDFRADQSCFPYESQPSKLPILHPFPAIFPHQKLSAAQKAQNCIHHSDSNQDEG